MAIQYEVNQSTLEEKIYPLDFSPGLLEDVVVTDVLFEYSGDNEDDDLPEYSLITINSDNVAYVSLKSLAVGYHKLRCVAVTDNDDLSPEICLLIITKT